MTNLDPAQLAAVTGGGAMRTAWNFSKGAVAGALYGPGAQTSQIDRFGDRNDPGFAPGVETGMMGNMALGPFGGAIATAAGSVPMGSSQ